MARFVPRGFYALADLSSGATVRDPADVMARARAVLRAKPCCLQLRAKGVPDAEVRDLGRALARVCQQAAVPFCVNDRVDLALAVGADVVHLGQDDLPVGAARKILQAAGASLVVGVSTHDLDQARQAAADGADYIGFGPVFATRSKENPDPVVGLRGLATVVGAVSLPVVAIGGITLDNLRQVVTAGAHAAAVIAAVWGAPDPEQAAHAVARGFREPLALPADQPKRPVM